MSENRNRRLRLKFDRQSYVLTAMESFARQGLRVLPIFGITNGNCDCGDADCPHKGKHPVPSLVRKGVYGATDNLKIIRKWHREYPNMNYGVATDGLAVIDCDSRRALSDFKRDYDPPSTLTVRTKRGGHLYFQGDLQTRTEVLPKLDIKSGGSSYVMGPGSQHESGTIYALWEDRPIADLPENIATITEVQDEPSAKRLEDGMIPVGLRNDTLTRFAGWLRGQGVPRISILAALKALNRSMAKNRLPDKEVERIAHSVSRYPAKELPRIIPFSEIPEEDLEFLWYSYICLGTLGLLDGDPGDGKSQFMGWLVSRVSTGRKLPNGKRIKPANCFLFNFEDLPGAVIKKRLEANGADLDRVFIQSRTFDLSKEMVEWLDGEIAEKKPSLVILDPIQAFMAGVDGNNNIDVREFMSRLSEIAEKRHCAIICVRHFGKGAQDKAMKKGLGSTDFVGISRNQFGLARRDDGVRGFIVFHMKTNFEKSRSMLFTMGDADGRKGEQPKIAFEGFTDMDADTFFSQEKTKRGPDQNERETAKEFLPKRLADGPVHVEILKRDGEARGISSPTLNRAAVDLGIVKARHEDKKWYWSLPPED